MYRAIVVTHRGPCSVPQDVCAKIVEKKRSVQSFGEQILYIEELNLADGIEVTSIEGEVEAVATLEDFEARFIMKDPPGERIIQV